MRIEIDNKHTYETNLEVKVGDNVLLPTADFLRDVKGPTYVGTVTSLTSSYTGACRNVIGFAPKTA